MIESRLLYSDISGKGKIEEKITHKKNIYKKITQLNDKFNNNGGYYGIIIFREKKSICMGFHEEEWVLIVTIGENGDEQYHSKGNLSRNTISEYYWMEWNGISDKSLVPKDKAWEAVQYWLDTGELSPVIEWSDELLF